MEHLLVSPRARVRATVLVLAVTAGAALGAATAGPLALRLVRAPGATFAELLVESCAGLALLAVAVLWLAAADVACQVLRGPARAGRRSRRLGPLRAGLLALCGAAVLAAPAARAAGPVADPAHPPAPPAPHLDATVLAGLPYPDLPVDGAVAVAGTVRVRPGDSLWSIAARALGPGARAGDVAAYWPRIHAANAAAVGPDPDLLHPGLVLRLPRPEETPCL